MKNNRTFKSLPTYGEIESGLFHKPAVCPKCKSDDWDNIGKNWSAFKTKFMIHRLRSVQ